ncbi:two-component system, OmpR family, sensor kinase [Actinacidiphila alni]|uniref:histidine kinase n=1 Tax=Actinacidiphila alni TaxID=380248 RepID=A0A1I1ZEA9_9ACTN|nr:HAMP domain-containing sensor histidine kinase [Actinacidiphila alni]SFE29922.1 two-component system, OmpR family, sensor kinase [Actinacidiphila alni]
MPSRPRPRPRKSRSRSRSWSRPWSLRRRLVASCVALVAVVCAVIGAVTIFALHDFLYGQLDGKVRDVAMRAAGPHADDQGAVPPAARAGRLPQNLLDDRPFGFLAGGGQPGETVGAIVGANGAITQAAVSATPSGGGPLEADSLTRSQTAAFAAVPLDGKVHTLTVPGLGTYRVESARQSADGTTVLVGLSTSGVQDTLDTLMWVEFSVAAAGLVAAGLAGAALMRIALQPLRRVAATATRVSELPLHSGEVALHERVPDSDTDPRTEVGQVGAALNRMLGHVGSALHARQESETRVRQFVADASHELRTPLASIRGYAELTRRGTESVGPDTRHALGRIESEAGRMTTLVEDLLLLARLDAGRPLSLAETDLSPLVVDAVSDARAAGRDHVWRLDLPDDPATVNGDAQRLHQVLTNLLANARTHTPPGTTVTARVTREGADILLQVVDDGPGIPADLQRQVFERFARGDASRTRGNASRTGTAGDGPAGRTGTAAGGSSGLGLAIVRSVVTAHGGEVTVDSVPGRTAFTVRLRAAVPPVSRKTSPVPQDSQVRPRLSTRS